MYAGNSKDSNIEFINIENMRKVLSIIYLIVLIVNGSYAQSSYPIYVSPALTPPYSLKLSDYSKFGSQQLVVNIAVNDLNVSNLPVKLHIKMETVGITIESLPTLNTTPIYLDGGAATILFGDDLADYFDINNLTFKGYSKEAYRRTGQLPEGFYKFTVEVLHFQTNRLISNAGTATAWISVGKPPVLKLPENGKELGEFKGMPIVFSWYASKLGNPMSAAGVQYKFEMWEMRVDGISPYTIAASVPLFHEETTSNTMVTVLPSSLLMEPGMKYAWRVTAMDVSGMVPFEQDGHSEMRVFTYKSKCNSVANLKADQHGRNGSFVWDPGSNHTSYNIELRKPATGWLSASETFDSKAEFYELDYATTYEMRVQAVCNGDPESVSDFSEWATLKIPAQRSKPDSSTCPTCGCSDSLGTGNIENLELRRDLKPGDTLSNRFGTTRFIVKSVEPQGDGVYKGHFLFWAELWKLKFVCEYWDLSVNTDNVILNMDYQSVYNPQFLLDVDATAAFLDSLAGAITDLTVSTTIKDTVTIGETISSIYVNAGDSVVAVTVDPDGTVHEVVIQTDADDIPKTIIQGENGEQFVVTGNGQVMGLDEYKHTGGNGRKLDEYKKEKEAHLSTTQVAFSASQNQTYGFDAFSEEKQALKSKYPSLQNGYTPAYKSIASFKPDKVVASSTESGITFRDEMGIPAIKSGNDLTVRGGTDGSVTALYAYKAVTDTTEEVAGKLNLMSFDEQAKKVYIVPVNGATMPDATTLKEVLNKVYAQAVTRWEVVKIEKGVTLTFPDGQMTHGGSSAIDVYNTDQKSIISKFKKDGNDIESDALYLFFVANVKGKTGDIAGYMPLQKQVGFIYDNPNPHIIAHELGHGAFNLRHVFSPESFVAAQGTTKNLMDYSGSTDLWQHQWELIHDPESLWFAWAQDESEGEGKENGPVIFSDEVVNLINQKAKEIYGEAGVTGIFHSKVCNQKVDKLSTSVQKYQERVVISAIAPSDNNPSVSVRTVAILYKNATEGTVSKFAEVDISKAESKAISETLTLYYYNGESDDCSDFLGKISCCDICEFSIEQLPDYINQLYDAAAECSKAKAVYHLKLIDRTNGLDAGLKTMVEQQLLAYEKVGIKAKIFLTDPSSSEADRKVAEEVINAVGDNELALWINIDGQNSKLVKYKVGKNSFILVDGINQSDQVEKLFAFLTTFSREDFLSFIISDLDVMAHLVQKLAIPEKYWNPNLGDEYNSSLFYIYTVANAQQTNLPLVILSSEVKRNAQLQFAIVCGIYNGAVGLVEAVPSGVSLILKLLVNEDDILSSIQEQFKEIDKNCLDQTNIYFYTVSIPGTAQSSLILYGPCAAEAIKKYFSEGDEFQQSHKYGKAIFDIATVFLSYTKIAKALDALDVVGLAIKAAKPILKGSLQAFKCGKKFIHFPNTLTVGSNVFRVVDDAGQVVAGDVAKSLRWVNAVDEAGNPIQVGLFESDAAVTGPVTLIKNKRGDLAQLDGDYYLAELPDNADGQLALVRKVAKAGGAFDDVLETASKFDDNVLEVAEVGLKEWKTFQNRVAEQILSKYPNSKIGNQITLDIYIKGRSKPITIIPDNLVQIEVNGIKKYKLIDAKTSIKNDLTQLDDLLRTCTKNQKDVYPYIDDLSSGNIAKVEMRGGQAEQAFGDLGNTGKIEIQLESGVEFWVNTNKTDFTKYTIRPRIK